MRYAPDAASSGSPARPAPARQAQPRETAGSASPTPSFTECQLSSIDESGLPRTLGRCLTPRSRSSPLPRADARYRGITTAVAVEFETEERSPGGITPQRSWPLQARSRWWPEVNPAGARLGERDPFPARSASSARRGRSLGRVRPGRRSPLTVGSGPSATRRHVPRSRSRADHR
jgi:hypothetical protein